MLVDGYMDQFHPATVAKEIMKLFTLKSVKLNCFETEANVGLIGKDCAAAGPDVPWNIAQDPSFQYKRTSLPFLLRTLTKGRARIMARDKEDEERKLVSKEIQ